MKKLILLITIVAALLSLKSYSQNKASLCGTDNDNARSGVQPNFVPQGSILDKTNLTYGIVNYTSDVSQSETQLAIAAAFNQWSIVTDNFFTFSYTSNAAAADIKISWVVGEHGDGKSFDNTTAIAHSFYPNSGNFTSQIHFDDAQDWSTNRLSGFDIQAFALHEIGHVLGLDHSNCSSAIMNAVVYGDRVLNVDDIVGIRTIYGRQNISTNLLNGATSICNSSDVTYQFDFSAVRFSGITWTVDPGLQIISGQNTSNLTVRLVNSNTTALVQANVTDCSNTMIYRKVVALGTPQKPGTITHTTDCPEHRFQILDVPGAINYTWKYYPYPGNGSSTTVNAGTSIKPYLSVTNTNYIVEVTANNACGSSTASVLSFYNSCPGGGGHRIATVSPNPANQTMNITTERQANDTTVILPYAYKLFDKQGAVLRQGKSDSQYNAVINTQDIPTDNYFLHIIYPKETIKKQVIIKH